MKLIIKRDQRPQAPGEHKGMRFFMTAKAELTPQEQELVTLYKKEGSLIAGFKEERKLYSLPDCIEGINLQSDHIEYLLVREQAFKDGCKNFKAALHNMAMFGGEEVVEF